MRRVLGSLVDDQTRCVHYRTALDVVAIRFRCCGEFYPCHLCHQESAGHAAVQWSIEERGTEAILCGVCGQELSIREYLDVEGCPRCAAPFNPGCRSHAHLYFQTATYEEHPPARPRAGGHHQEKRIHEVSIKHSFRGASRREKPPAPAGPRRPGIRLSDVTVTREGTDVLAGIDLSLDEHRVAVIGLNGSGKSTLVRLLNGLLLPTRGTVRVGELTTAKDAKAIRRQVGFVFQHPENQIVMPQVGEDIAFGAKNLGLRGAQLTTRVEEVLDRLGIAHLRERESYALSGGEKQLVALASVLVMDPATIVFDEPTTMLDRRNRRRLRTTIEALDQQAVVVTHDLEMIGGYDRVLVVHEGRIAFDGIPEHAVEYYCELSDR